MPILRSSQLDQFWDCGAWVGRVDNNNKEELSNEYPNAKKAADWGTMVHNWKQSGTISHPSKNKREEGLLKKRLSAVKIDRFQLWPVGGFHEVNCAYNWVYKVSTIEFCNNPETFRDRFDDEWITGTIDYLYVTEDSIIVDDLKTGAYWDKKPEESAQILFYCLCVWRANKVSSILSTVTHWPKYPATAPPNVLPSVVTTKMLMSFEKNLHKKLTEIDLYHYSTRYNPSESSCKFCPNRLICPERWEDGKEDNVY